MTHLYMTAAWNFPTEVHLLDKKGTTYKSSLQFLLLYLANKKIFQYVKKTETFSYSCFL